VSEDKVTKRLDLSPPPEQWITIGELDEELEERATSINLRIGKVASGTTPLLHNMK